MALMKNEYVRLRALEPEDLDLVYKWENDSSLWTIGNTVAPYSRYALEEYIAESRLDLYALKQLRMMIEERRSDKAVGMVDLFDLDMRNLRAGTGILLDPEFQQNGLAREALTLLKEYAFSFLGLHQLYAHIPAHNKRSLMLFTRCDFKFGGMLNHWIFVDGGYEDVLFMQLVNISRPGQKDFYT
jgi:diamine N-acetyltransferase